jgi:hypothetical protein
MGHFFDQAARVIASPMPRREALKALGGAAAAGILASLGIKTASAQSAPTACQPACKATQQCCTTGTKATCRDANQICCGNDACAPNQFCCNTGAKPFCRTAKKTCCGDVACGPDQTCCSGKCCPKNQSCVNGRCQASQG